MDQVPDQMPPRKVLNLNMNHVFSYFLGSFTIIYLAPPVLCGPLCVLSVQCHKISESSS